MNIYLTIFLITAVTGAGGLALGGGLAGSNLAFWLRLRRPRRPLDLPQTRRPGRLRV